MTAVLIVISLAAVAVWLTMPWSDGVSVEDVACPCGRQVLHQAVLEEPAARRQLRARLAQDCEGCAALMQKLDQRVVHDPDATFGIGAFTARDAQPRAAWQLSEAKSSRPARCFDCGLPYLDDGFCDLVVPSHAWDRMVPDQRQHGAGLLCPTCMVRRAHQAGLEKVPAVFTSGPFAIESADGASTVEQVLSPFVTAPPDPKAGKCVCGRPLLDCACGGWHPASKTLVVGDMGSRR